MEILFLGTGGGRFNLIRQVRRTAGFCISGPLRIHVDPGPGILPAAAAYKQDLSKTDVIVVTHNHIDHMNDAGLLIEAMVTYSKKRNWWKANRLLGWLISTKSMIKRDEYGEKGISSYFLERLARLCIAQTGKEIKISIGGKKATLLPVPVKHEDRSGFGFVLSMGGKRIGYTSDTEYFKGLGQHYAGCDALIVNCLKPRKDRVPGHLYTESTMQLLKEAQPKLAILSHMGIAFLEAGPGKEARKIEKASGVKTIAATDGMKINLGNPGLTHI